jgi:hypothetical protein
MRAIAIAFTVLGVSLAGCATTGSTGDGTPVLQKVVLREEVMRYDNIYPTFYFQADGGDVVEIHREILSSDVPHPNFNPVSHFNIDADKQKAGAVWVGGWRCGPNPSRTTVRAYLVDRRGNHSNSLDYTVVCKGAKELSGGQTRP